MKITFFFLSVILGTSAFATPIINGSLLKAHYQGSAQEHQLQTLIASASIDEVSRSEFGNSQVDTVTYYFATSNTQSSEYLAVLHDAEQLDLTLDLAKADARSGQLVIPAKVQIQGDDDQFRKAAGTCVLSEADKSLNCQLTPISNPFGMLKDTSLHLVLK